MDDYKIVTNEKVYTVYSLQVAETIRKFCKRYEGTAKIVKFDGHNDCADFTINAPKFRHDEIEYVIYLASQLEEMIG